MAIDDVVQKGKQAAEGKVKQLVFGMERDLLAGFDERDHAVLGAIAEFASDPSLKISPCQVDPPGVVPTHYAVETEMWPMEFVEKFEGKSGLKLTVVSIDQKEADLEIPGKCRNYRLFVNKDL